MGIQIGDYKYMADGGRASERLSGSYNSLNSFHAIAICWSSTGGLWIRYWTHAHWGRGK